MRRCPECNRYGVEREWNELWVCGWRDCSYREQLYIKPNIKIKFKRFIKRVIMAN